MKINANKAHAIFKSFGIDLSYPTVVKRLHDWGISEQVAGKQSSIIVDQDKLIECLKRYYPQHTKGRHC